MPNWCSNRVDISFTTDEFREKFVKEMNLENGEFDFNKLVPEPDWLNTPNKSGELPKEKELKFGEHIEKVRYFSDGSHDDRWYSWRLENWGCKWTPSHVELVENMDGWIRVCFDTPWGPPEEICAKLREEEYISGVSWFYDEPGMELAGYL